MACMRGPFLQVIAAYCNKRSVDMGSVRFLFDGTRINPNSTPEDVSGDRPGSGK